ncbi:MAG: hypothetical protein AAGI17_02765 [Planctomycetota bacterium]
MAESWESILDSVRSAAEAAEVFGSVGIVGGTLECTASGSAEEASYRLVQHDGARYVELVMKDRWQSESIEADLMHSGDSLDELLEEELIDQGYDGGSLAFEHYRSDDMLFTFRSPLPEGAGSDVTAKCLLAYEACFRNLGDMSADEDD